MSPTTTVSTIQKLRVSHPGARISFVRELWTAGLALVLGLALWMAVGSRINSQAALEAQLVVRRPEGLTFRFLEPNVLAWGTPSPLTVTLGGPRERVEEAVANPERVRVVLEIDAGDVGQERTVMVAAQVKVPSPLTVISASPSEVRLRVDRQGEGVADVRRPQDLAVPVGFRLGTWSFTPSRVHVLGPEELLQQFLKQKGSVVTCEPPVLSPPEEGSSGAPSVAVRLRLPPGLTCREEVVFSYQLLAQEETRTFELPVRCLLDPEQVGAVEIQPLRSERVEVKIGGTAESLDVLAEVIKRGSAHVFAFVNLRQHVFEPTEPGKRKTDSAILSLRLPTTSQALQELGLPPDTSFVHHAVEVWEFRYSTTGTGSAESEGEGR